MPIEETEIFRIFEEIADWVWENVDRWEWKAQKTVGLQLIRAIDSVNANLVEGDGRYSSSDALHFFIVARASAREARLWIRRAMNRGLIAAEEAPIQLSALDAGSKQLNRLITFRRSKRGTLAVREEDTIWDPEVIV